MTTLTASPRNLFDAARGRRCGQDDLRPDQHQAANHGERQFHDLNIVGFGKRLTGF
jgi:hypothetical protein